MRERADELEALGVRVYAVTFESASRSSEFQREDPLSFPLLLDSGRTAYRRFGLGRKPVSTVWGLKTLWYYGVRLLQGELPASSRGADTYQLGGDVLLRPGMTGGWIFRSESPVDRPSVESVVDVLRATQAK